MSDFKLIAGVSIPDTTALKREYRLQKSKLTLTLSADDYRNFFVQTVKKLAEPVFFFLEIPDDNDAVRTYYLDNCTAPVAQAILKRYGGILYADGVIKFGFGSHKTDDEIYMQEYQTVTIYSERIGGYEKMIQKLGYQRNDKALTAWDIISEKNPGECVNVDVDEESYFDMVNNLVDVGMYPAE